MYIIYYKVAQIFTLLTSIGTFIYIFHKKKQKEFKFVLSVEIVTYICSIIIPLEYLVINDVALFRYLSWVLTCPIMLMNLLHVNGIKKLNVFMDVIIMDLMIIVLGIISAFCIIWLKLIMFACAGFVFSFLFYYIYKLCDDKNMIIIFFLSWSVFPIFFLLGPEGFKVVSVGTSMLLQSIGDLMSKNLVGSLSWF